jgi:hypothetical protein
MNTTPQDMIVGDFHEDVMLELIKDDGISRPRMMPVGLFPSSTRVEVSRSIRERFPLGTRFVACVKICQKHNADGSCNGNPYLKVYGTLKVILDTISDQSLIARLDPTGADGRKYYYVEITS